MQCSNQIYVLNEGIQWEDDGTTSTMMIPKKYFNDWVIHDEHVGWQMRTFASALDSLLHKNIFVGRFVAN